MSLSAQLAKTRPQMGHIWPQGHLTPKYFSVPHLVAHQQNPQQLRRCQSTSREITIELVLESEKGMRIVYSDDVGFMHLSPQQQGLPGSATSS